ncbi:PH domain-containing protein [Intrasporangium flavum]|uniref:PH domain-containing protein n=1 Tax=Intrasporangium flavum TaxID=1428657 RepID=UPI00096CBD00|nr:PH domain-containing protein [Intrasporangium flavum]
MGFPENVLARGERVERDLHPHWLTVVGPTLVGLVVVAVCVLAVVWTPNDSTGNTIQWIAVAVLVVVAVAFVVTPYLRWRTTRYVITSHRVMVRRGILTKTGKDITLSKITDVSFEQTLLDRLIRSGSLHIESAGDSPDENLRYIPRSNEVQQLINRLIDEDDLRRRAHGRGEVADAYDAGYDDAGYDDARERGAGSVDDTTVIRQGRRDPRDRPPLAEERRRPGTAGDDTY